MKGYSSVRVWGEQMYEEVDVVAHKINSPSLIHFATEMSRATFEGMTLGSLWPLLEVANRNKSAGDGHPVLVLPGFLGGDASTLVCRQFLRRCGFNAMPWHLGTNTGRESLQNDLLKLFLRLRRRHRQPISLVGHSLGGVFAREIARQFPDDVRCVVSLGSPFAVAHAHSVSRIVSYVFERVSGESVEEKRRNLLHTDPRMPPGVPSTSIFSRSDGVVHWQSCLEQVTDSTENIEVYGSHCGMVVNASVLQAVQDRLAQEPGAWQKFKPSRLGYPRQRNNGA